MANTPVNVTGLPRGTGVLQFHGRSWWAAYTDENGRKVQANTHTADEGEARRFLLRANIRVHKAQLTILRWLLDEPQSNSEAGAAGRRPGAKGADRAAAQTHDRDRQEGAHKRSRGGK